MILYWSSRPGHTCPATNFFKVTSFATFSSLSESVSYLTGCCMSCFFLLPKFQSRIFNPCNPLQQTDDGKQYQCQNIALNNKTGPIFFGIQLMQKRSFNFLKRQQIAWHSPVTLVVGSRYILSWFASYCQTGQKFSIQSLIFSCHCLHRRERQLRLLTKAWK